MLAVSVDEEREGVIEARPPHMWTGVEMVQSCFVWVSIGRWTKVLFLIGYLVEYLVVKTAGVSWGESKDAKGRRRGEDNA